MGYFQAKDSLKQRSSLLNNKLQKQPNVQLDCEDNEDAAPSSTRAANKNEGELD